MSNTPEIVKEGWLKRVKNQKRRYFVLCFSKSTGAAQLQYFESEKKYHSKPEPKRTINLRDCLGIICREDPKEGKVLVLYTKEDIFCVTSDSDESLQSWLNDLDKLHQMEYRNLQDSKYDLVWNVTVIPRGLGGIKNMTGSYKLCLKNDKLYFVNPGSQEVVTEERLCNIRRYGHMNHCFFMEFGRSTTLGAGEIWMEAEDPLIAQKIHETLSRTVKPAPAAAAASGDYEKPIRPSSRSNRHSMVHVDPRSVLADTLNNNEPSPRMRRSFLLKVFAKKQKDTTRPHSKSVSGDPALEHESMIRRKSNDAPPYYMNQPDKAPTNDDVFLSNDKKTPKHDMITTYSRLVNKLEQGLRRHPAATCEIYEFTAYLGSDAKAPIEDSVDKTGGNEYAMLKPKQRSVMKLDCNAVRKQYVEQHRSRSLPRRSSSSSTERQRIGSNMSTDSDCACSDGEERRHSFDRGERHYSNISPLRSPVPSDSSNEDHAPLDLADHYIPMHSPLSIPKPTIPWYAARSRGSSKPEPAADHDSGESPYMNMSPDQASVCSPEDEETFDHLHRNVEDSSPSNEQSYVNMSRPAMDSGKSRSVIQRKKPSDYVNVDRSHSVGSKIRPRPLFEIVPENHPPSSSDDEASAQRPPASNYVNMKINGTSQPGTELDSTSNYAKYTPPSNVSPEGRKTAAMLNYTSVAFAEKKSATSNGVHRSPYPEKKTSSNYSTIDITKSKVLEEISSSRELQLQQGIHN